MSEGMRYFGEKWDAPMTDDAVQVDVPTDMTCMSCQERFQDGDQGLINLSGYAQHKECGLRSVMGGIGHLVDHARYCDGPLGPDAGLSYRRSAILVWSVWNGTRITPDDLEQIRMEDTGG